MKTQGENMKNIIKILSENGYFTVSCRTDINIGNLLQEADNSIYAKSVCLKDVSVYFLRKKNNIERELIIIRPEKGSSASSVTGINTKETVEGEDYLIRTCEADTKNAYHLMNELEYLKPRPLGIKPSFGMGDRIGNATPGHILAVQDYAIHPVFAQQSIREMDRTIRTPREVMADATWAIFQEGFDGIFGADADHLKTFEDVKATAEAGFTFFTIDPSDHLVFEADNMADSQLKTELEKIFPVENGVSLFMEHYSGKTISLDGGAIHLSASDTEIMKCAVKFATAIRHTVSLYNVLCGICGGPGRFDFEMSIDETPYPTTSFEHYFIAEELRKAGVIFTSLAPRYTGEFQKGIDFIGNIDEFRKSLHVHAAIARELGPYKLSIHSGSDKFTIFPIFSEETRGMFHEKTAGTTYLEAIRVISEKAPALYREIHEFSLGRFEKDRASYHVTTDLSQIPDLQTLRDNELPALLNDINARQLLHITYGSVLTAKGPSGQKLFYNRILTVLHDNETHYYETVKKHFQKHMNFLGVSKKQI